MGCDIHLYVERKVNGVWESADKWGPDKYDESDGRQVVDYDDRFYTGRNYDLFAILANVRNGRGFAGCETGEGFNVIAEPRGLPDDCTAAVRADSDNWGCDGHSHSWLTLQELLAFDWTQTTKHYGVVDAAEFAAWDRYDREKGLGPKSWSGGVGGQNVRKISVEEMDAKLAEIRAPFIDSKRGGWAAEFEQQVKQQLCNFELEHFYCRIEWTEPYFRSCREFWWQCIPKLLRLGKPEDVRLVFWFDN